MNTYEERQKEKGMNNISAGLFGIILGVIGSLTALALMKKSTRQKIEENVTKLKEKTIQTLSQLQNKAEDVEQQAHQEAKEKLNATKKPIEETKDEVKQ